jgi:hypothetical protein
MHSTPAMVKITTAAILPSVSRVGALVGVEEGAGVDHMLGAVVGAGEGARRLYVTAPSVTGKPLLTMVCCTVDAKDGDSRAAVTTAAVVLSEVTVYEAADPPASRPRRVLGLALALIPLAATVKARPVTADVGSPRAVDTPARKAAENAALLAVM